MLITKADILTYWPISVNMDDSRINPYIVRAEQNQLSALLSPELYYALSEAVIVPDDRFDKLLNGTDYVSNSPYVRKYEGIKPLLCAYAFSMISANNDMHITRGGNVRKTDENSTNATNQDSNTISMQSYSEAIRLEGEFYLFMSREQSKYPEYRGGHPSKSSSFNFFNASRGSNRYDFE